MMCGFSWYCWYCWSLIRVNNKISRQILFKKCQDEIKSPSAKCQTWTSSHKSPASLSKSSSQKAYHRRHFPLAKVSPKIHNLTNTFNTFARKRNKNWAMKWNSWSLRQLYLDSWPVFLSLSSFMINFFLATIITWRRTSI